MYFDSHAHYDDERFDQDRDELLTEMHNKNVDLILNSGESIDSAKKTLELIKKYPFIYGAVGIHPHNAKKTCESDINLLRDYSKNDKIVAIGEIGLDYYYDTSPRDKQRYWFKRQLELADARKTDEVAEAVPIEKIVIETDCPYLAPAPMRSKRNNSMYLEYIAEKISQIKNIPHKEVAEITKNNAVKLFNISNA